MRSDTIFLINKMETAEGRRRLTIECDNVGKPKRVSRFLSQSAKQTGGTFGMLYLLETLYTLLRICSDLFTKA